MAESYSFIRYTEDDLILINARLGNTLLELVLDTGASHTFIDFGILIKEGFRLSDTKGLVPVETANGVIFANRFEVPFFAALGIQKTKFEVTSYLFDDPETEHHGVLGLDFLENTKFCIDLAEQTISIQPKN